MAAPSRTLRTLWAAVAAAVALSCIIAARARETPPPPRLAAAASLAGVLEPWSSEHNVDLHLSATGVLVSQLLAGARADAVLLADHAWLAPLIEAGWCEPHTAVPVASNTLVLAGPKLQVSASGSTPSGPSSPTNPWDPTLRLAIGDPNLVPAGRYARQALTALGRWKTLAPNLLRAPDASAAAAWVRTGAADAAVLYATDTTPGRGLTVWQHLDSATHDRIDYLVVPAAGSPRGARLAAVLQTQATAAAFAAHGFGPASAVKPSPVGHQPRPTANLTGPVVRSLACAAAATALCFLPAVGLAAALTRRRQTCTNRAPPVWRRGLRTAIEALVLLPVVVPPVVCGWAVLKLLGPHTLGQWSPVFTWQGAAIAQAVVALPFWVVALRAGLQQIDPAVLDAARCDGATPRGVLWRVALPLATPALLAGGLLSFARALGEFGATIVVAGNIAGHTRTVPLALYTALQTPGAEPQAAALVALAVALGCATTGAAVLLRGATLHRG